MGISLHMWNWWIVWQFIITWRHTTPITTFSIPLTYVRTNDGTNNYKTLLIKATSIHLHSSWRLCSKPLKKTCFSLLLPLPPVYLLYPAWPPLLSKSDWRGTQWWCVKYMGAINCTTLVVASCGQIWNQILYWYIPSIMAMKKPSHIYPILWPVFEIVGASEIQLWQNLGPKGPLMAVNKNVVAITHRHMMWPLKPNGLNRWTHPEYFWRGFCLLNAKIEIPMTQTP